MQFLWPHHRFYAFGVAYSKTLRYSGTLAAIVAVIGLWYATAHRPLNHRIADAQAIRATLHRQHEDYLTHQTMIATTQQVIAELSRALQTVRENHAHVTLPDRMINLIECINTSGLRLLRSSYGKEIVKEGYGKQRILYTLQGSFEDLMAFLNHLAAQAPLIQCKHVTIEQGSDHALLTITCTIEYVMVLS